MEIDSKKQKMVEETIGGLQGLEFNIETDIVTYEATLEQPEEILEICLSGDDASEALAFLYSTKPEVMEVINRLLQPLVCTGAFHKDLIRYTLEDHLVISDSLEEWGDLLFSSGYFQD